MCLRCIHGCFCLHAPAYECAVPVCTCMWMSVDVCEHVCASVYLWVLCVPMCSCVCVPRAHVGARILCPHVCKCDHRCGAGLSGRVKWKGQGPTSGSPRESGGTPICRAPSWVSVPPSPPTQAQSWESSASVGSRKPGRCGAELPTWAVVQSASRAPSGAVGSSG